MRPSGSWCVDTPPRDSKSSNAWGPARSPRPSLWSTTCGWTGTRAATRSSRGTGSPASSGAWPPWPAGTVYDPKLTEAFVRMLGIYPVGTLVRLTTRELAVVLRPQDEPTRPVVRLVAAADGTLLEDGAEISLMEKHPQTNDYVRSILLAVDPSAKNIDVGRFLKPAE